jgi:hypothetical protein
MRNIPLNIMIIILLIFSMSFCSARAFDDSLTVKIISYIEKTTGNKPIFYLPQKIGFTLSSLSEDVIRRNYVKGFDYSRRNLFLEKESLIKNVEDSLKDASDKFNRYCPVKIDSIVVSFDKKSNGNVLLLSHLCSGVIFAELVNSYGVLIGRGGLELSGTVRTFMFKVADGEIVEVYSGVMYCN